MKIIWWADVHCEHSIKSDNIKGETQSFLVLEELKKHAIAENPDWIVVLGDLLDKHGILESSLAVYLQNQIEELNQKHGINFIFITGNHEYQTVQERYFGKGLLQAIFGNLRHNGIYVIDGQAEFIRLDNSHVVLGLPYRDTKEQFEQTCLIPMQEALESGKVNPEQDKILSGWHVGLPWGNTWRGDEDENLWLRPDYHGMELLFRITHDRHVFCGHYHGPNTVPFGDLGFCTYIGSPATATRAESDQDKRVGIWEDGKMRYHSTGLILDKIVSSLDEADAHQKNLVQRFGHDVLNIASIHVNLGPDSSMAEFNLNRERAATMPGKILIGRPAVIKKSPCHEIVEQYKQRDDVTRAQMEEAIFKFSVRHYFKNTVYKDLDDQSMVKILDSLTPSICAQGREVIETTLKDEIDMKAMPELTDDNIAMLSKLVLTYQIANELISTS